MSKKKIFGLKENKAILVFKELKDIVFKKQSNGPLNFIIYYFSENTKKSL